MRRFGIVIASLLAVSLLMVGCSSPSMEGTWIQSENGSVMTIDAEWFITEDGEQLRYEITGDTALQITDDGEVADVRYELDGDTLSLTVDGDVAVMYREGSNEAKDLMEDLAAAEVVAQCNSSCKSLSGLLGRPIRQAEAYGGSSGFVTLAEFEAALPKEELSVREVIEFLVDIDWAQDALLDDLAQYECPEGGDVTFAPIFSEPDNKYTRWHEAVCSIHGSGLDDE